jgi:hypothetical protein
MSSIALNLISAAIAGLATYLWQRVASGRKRKKRLHALQQATASGEVAICLRVGGNADPLPDVEEYLTTKMPQIKQILFYQVSSEDAGGELDNPDMANRIVEDIYEGIRAYGRGKFTRVHFFPAGMLAYPPIASAMLSNWCPVVVYHKTASSYVPLYEINKDRFNQGKRDFKSLTFWSTQEVGAPSSR